MAAHRDRGMADRHGGTEADRESGAATFAPIFRHATIYTGGSTSPIGFRSDAEAPKAEPKAESLN